jgi:hypothetical protein
MTDKHDTPKTVTVEAIKAHSYNGKAYAIGDTYEIDEQFVDSVAAQGMAVRLDRVAHAKAQADASEKARKAASHPVAPLTTDDLRHGHTKPTK